MKNNKTVSVYKTAAYLLLLMGIIHSALTPYFYTTLSITALWFLGTGLALIFVSMLNIAAIRGHTPWLLTLALFANLIGTLYAVMISIVLNQPQAHISLVIFLVVLFSGWSVRKQIAT